MILARCLAALLVCATVRGAPTLVITAANPGALARPAETLAVPWSDVARLLPGALLQHLVVRDPQGRSVPYQVTNVRPDARDPQNVGLAYGDLLFQHDFAAGEASAAFTVERTEAVALPFPPRVFARFVPERLDDFAWENDKIAHRTYGPALAAPDVGHTGKETETESGIDVWCKRVSYLTVDRWYTKGHYHQDEGEGLDMYEVGPSRGCGGTGIWDGHTLATSGNFESWKVIANGPIRAIFELRYAPWDADGRRVAETKRYTVDAGRYLDQIDSTFTVAGGPAGDLTVGIGLDTASADKGQDPHYDVAADPRGTLAIWQVEKTHGAIGTAVIVPAASLAGFARDPLNELILARAAPGVPLRFYAGAAWSRAGEITTAGAWNDYVAQWAARIRRPVEVRVSRRG
jgi:pectinesterase